MTERPDASDVVALRRASRRIGAAIAGAFTVVLTVGVVILVAVITATGRFAAGPDGDPHGAQSVNADHVVVDVDRVVPWVIGLGLVGIVVMGLIAVLIARRAVAPLAEALRVQRRFVADAGHELRTPLTALYARVQTAQRRDDRGEDVTGTLAALRADAETMNDVLTDLLLVAAPSATASADVAGAVAEAVRLLEPVAAAAHVRLRAETASGAAVPLPTTALTRMVVALLDNAIHHAPAGTEVLVAGSETATAVELRVIDHGSGLDGVAPEDVFARFVRGAESGRRRGFGIGLALVRELAVRAGGTVAVERTGPDGTVFRLDLPRISGGG
ncbi:sensor histidine kinase [Microbacterium gorillae]|uniref:sensor histidine kinase n=1 Tax=Microbacterium gorillae TaxID=1231063 RepID=UPI00058AFAE0|nr:HAMP domain-containing sensor histidine kinase [Microbacterium gorillae]